MWLDTLNVTFNEVFRGFAEFIPKLIVALVLFIIGWIVGAALSKVIEQIIKAIKIDKALEGAGADKVLARAGFRLNTGLFLGELVKWFVIIIFLVASFNVLGLSDVNAFLQGVVIGYVPQVIAAVLILVIAVILAEFLKKLVTAGAKASNVSSANFLGSVTKWSIWIFAVLAALFQLGIAQPFIQTIFTGVIIALSLSIGLSFGLGGQDAAASFIDKVKREISDKN